MNRALAGVFSTVAVLSAVAVCGCVSSAAIPLSQTGAVGVKASSCPKGGEGAIEQIRSTQARAGALAPSGTLWTTICRGHMQTVLKAGPIDSALNNARDAPHEICPTDAVTPTLVILRYQTGTRWLIVNMGGCPGVVLRNGTELSFTASGITQVQAALAKTGAARKVASRSGASTGVVTGTLAIYAGVKETDRCGCVFEAGTVRLIGAGRQSVDVNVGKSGRFSEHVPTGRYEVIAGLKRPMEWPMGSCRDVRGADARYDRRDHSSYIVVGSGRQLHVDVGCLAG